MLQLVDLSFDLGGDPRIGMAGGNGHDAAEEIQILLAVSIPQVLHAGVIGDQGIREVR